MSKKYRFLKRELFVLMLLAVLFLTRQEDLPQGQQHSLDIAESTFVLYSWVYISK